MSEKHLIPTSLGIILDGNRRWAKERGLPSFAGHKAGYGKVKEFLAWAQEAGIRYATLYAFSTENWNRTTEEVNYFMDLIRLLAGDLEEFKNAGYRFRFIGDHARFPHDIQELFKRTESETALNKGLTVVTALSYGGQDEIIAAVNKLMHDKGRSKGEVTKEELYSYMWSHDIPFPDLIIRPGGEKRLSNFLTWQSVYAELFFIPTFWPAFSRQEFQAILDEYAARHRRFGK